MSDARQKFEEILRETQRSGIDNVLSGLAELGFFEAPASTRFHGNEPGGLLTHSLNVYTEAMLVREIQVRLRPDLAERLPVASVAIAALLHDVCKAEVYKSEIKHRKNAAGKWEDYMGWSVDYSTLPVGHGEKSVVRLLQWGLSLTEDEILAIRWHMGAFDLSPSYDAQGNYNAAKEKSPLLTIISVADGLASYMMERTNK